MFVSHQGCNVNFALHLLIQFHLNLPLLKPLSSSSLYWHEILTQVPSDVALLLYITIGLPTENAQGAKP